MENLKLYIEYDETRRSRPALIRELDDLLINYAVQRGLRYVRLGIEDKINYEFGWRMEPQKISRKKVKV